MKIEYKKNFKLVLAFVSGILISIPSLATAWFLTFAKYFTSAQLENELEPINFFISVYVLATLMLFAFTVPIYWKQKGMKLNLFLSGFVLSILIILYYVISTTYWVGSN